VEVLDEEGGDAASAGVTGGRENSCRFLYTAAEVEVDAALGFFGAGPAAGAGVFAGEGGAGAVAGLQPMER